MRLTFLGTGTSMGVPVAGGFGSERLKGDPRDERWRCSAWIETEETSIVIDTGPEFRLQTLRSGITKIDAVLITHEHMDHISGLDDLRPFCYKQQQIIPVFTSVRCKEAIRRRFEYMFGPHRYPGATSVKLNVLKAPLEFKDVTITPLPANHGDVDVLGFRIGKLSYLTDVKAIPGSTEELIKGSEVLVLSGLRWKPTHPTHMTIPEAVEQATKLEAPKTFLIHMNSRVNHKETTAKLPEHVRLAYDQLVVEVE